MIREEEEGMVPFKAMALLFGEDVGRGDVATLHSVEKSFHKLKDTKIGLGFDRRKVVGYVKHLRQTPEGLEVEGLVKEEYASKGRPSVAGEIIEKDGNQILDWKLMEIGWLLQEEDPRCNTQGPDLKRLYAAEKVARLALKVLDLEGDSPERQQAVVDLEAAAKEWESLQR